jgi:hypothetical protein
MSDSYRKAADDFSKAVALDPNNMMTWSGLGVAYMYMEHVDPGGSARDLAQISHRDSKVKHRGNTMGSTPCLFMGN